MDSNTNRINNNSFNFNRLPVDILSLVFSIVLSVPPSETSEKHTPPTVEDQLTLNRLSMVSKDFNKASKLFKNSDSEKLDTLVNNVFITSSMGFPETQQFYRDHKHERPFSDFESDSQLLVPMCKVKSPFCKVRNLVKKTDFLAITK